MITRRFVTSNLLAWLCLVCCGKAAAQVVLNEISAASSDQLLRVDGEGPLRLGWGLSWYEEAFDDEDWPEGQAPFGFGVEGIATDLGEAMLGRTPSLYLRKTFVVSADEAARDLPLTLTAQADSGFVAYVNGQEIARANLGALHGFVYHGQSAFSSAQSDEALVYESNIVASDILRVGENVFAVQVQNTVPSQINERDQTIDETLSFTGTLGLGPDLAIDLNDEGWKYRVGHAEPSGGLVDWKQAADPDVEGGFSDWIELHNQGGEAVDLGGWHLTDSRNEPDKWTFPDGVVIPAGGYLLVLADGLTEVSGDYLHASFRLSAAGEFLGLSDADGTFVSQFEDEFPEQFPFSSYGVGADGVLGYFHTPSPGRVNGGIDYQDAVKKPKFEPAGGVYDQALSVTITSKTEGAEIRYTLDGSEPNQSNGMLYDGPIEVGPIDDRTGTAIRARAFMAGRIDSPDNAQTYLVGVDEVFSSIPSLSLVGDSGQAFYKPHGILSVEGLSRPQSVSDYYMPAMHGRSFERRISMEVLYPDDGSHVQIDGGLRLSASAFSRFNFSLGRTELSPWPSEPPQKPSFNLFFRNDYGDDTLNFPFVEDYPVRDFQQFRLRAGKNDIVSPFIVDEMARRIYTDTGQFGSKGIQHALFVNGSYKGYYNTVARLREPLFQEFYGRNEPWQVKHIDVWADGSPLDDKLQDTPEWEHVETLLKEDLNVLANYQAVMAELDPVSFADYFIVNLYGATEDWPNNNLVIARELSDLGRWRPYMWDAEVSYGVQSSHGIDHDSIRVDLSQLDRGPSNDLATVWSRLTRSDEWRLLFADRLQKHFFTSGGALTKANLTARMNELAEELAPLMAFAGPEMDTSEIAEWIEGREEALFAGGILKSHDLWGNLPVPVFSPPSGSVDAGAPIAMTFEEDLTRAFIYYTTDGSDPRLIGGELSPTAILFDPDNAPVVQSSTTIRARVQRKTVFTSTWGALSEATYCVGLAPAGPDNLLISEFLVDPADPSEEEALENFSASSFEYLEIYNPSTVRIDLADLQFTAGITYDFGEGSLSTLGPQSYGVIVNDRDAFTARYGNALSILGEYSKNLSNAGERLEIANRQFETIVSVTYGGAAPWPVSEGKALVFAELDVEKDPNDPANWMVSAMPGGTPGHRDGNGEVLDFEEAVRLAGESTVFTRQGDLRIGIVQPTGAAIRYTLETSDDLRTWQPMPFQEVEAQEMDAGLRMVTYELPARALGTQSFARWHLEVAP